MSLTKIQKKFIETLRKGFAMGKLKKMSRDDLYDRRVFFD